MRKIEQQMLQAIRECKDWKLDNTEVICTKLTHTNRTIDRITVFLHGWPIALITPDSVDVCDYGYQTTTTKSRLNAVLRDLCGAGIYQRNHQWYGYAIEETDWEIDKHTRHVFVRG